CSPVRRPRFPTSCVTPGPISPRPVSAQDSLRASRSGATVSGTAGTLAILVGGGVPLLAPLDYGANAMSNPAMQADIKAAIERAGEGDTLVRALAAARMLHVVGSEEASGKLEPMLDDAWRRR
ncbi:MAG TPA: type II secretion system F family protein, partial [Rhodanobacter sp.]|nr:type II secretion system F family protein [Rhodanobacter sp.]